MGTEPLTPDDGRREQPPCADSSNPSGGKTVCCNREGAFSKDTCHRMICVRIALSRENGCSTVHVVVAKESDVTEHNIQVESKYKEMRHATLETRGRESAKRGGGVWARWTAQALFASTRTHDEPRRSGKCGYIGAGLLRAALTCPIRAARACAVLDCWRHGIASQRSPVQCLLPCIRALREKENFQLFHFVQPLKTVHFRRPSCQVGEEKSTFSPTANSLRHRHQRSRT